MNARKPSRGRIVVGGMMFYYPVPGVAWQHLHYLIGLQRLGWEVDYIEEGYWHSHLLNANSTSLEIASHLQWVVNALERFGFADHWHYHAAWDGRSYGIKRATAQQLLREADVFLNVCGSQLLTEDHMKCPHRIFLETDPVAVQIKLAQSDDYTRTALQNHTALFTFGENVGTAACPLSTGGFTWHPTRQPVVMDEWSNALPPTAGAAYTTIGNWEAKGKDIEFEGKIYHWQKSLEFLKLRELPRRVNVPFRLAMNFDNPTDRAMMEAHGWQTQPSADVSTDLDVYRTFIQRSRGEFTVAKEQNIVFQTGWFSDRAATYLAAGRPVINQDTGFARNLPVGEGLFSFATLEDSVAAINVIEADYARHCSAAREMAREYFSAERVLAPLLERTDKSTA